MAIIGVILMLLGAGGAYYGYNQNNNMEAQLESIFSSGSKDPGTIFIIAGAAVAVIGLVLLIAGVAKKRR